MRGIKSRKNVTTSPRLNCFATNSDEAIEHVQSPKQYVEIVRVLLKPGGVAIISTPCHSYLKNLALGVTGKMDEHFTAIWEGGHIKFWNAKTLSSLFEGVGLKQVSLYRVGRIPQLAKSMIVFFGDGT